MTHAIGFGAKFHVKQRNKYNARKVVIDGHEFASDKEGRHYVYLKQRQRSGEISLLALHPRTDLVVNGVSVGRYTADFTYEESGVRVWDDVKGFKARDWAIRSKVFQALHPKIELRINGIAAKKPKPPNISRAKRGPSQPDSSTPSKTKVHEWMPRKIEFRKARASARDKG